MSTVGMWSTSTQAEAGLRTSAMARGSGDERERFYVLSVDLLAEIGMSTMD